MCLSIVFGPIYQELATPHAAMQTVFTGIVMGGLVFLSRLQSGFATHWALIWPWL